MISILVFVVSLPIAVYTLAGLFLLVDLMDRVRAVVQITLRLLLLTGFVLITPVSSRIWIAVAFALVAGLHAAAQLLLRYAIRSGRWPTQRID
jgi:predicted tellurium resistance membrane protein TerC